MRISDSEVRSYFDSCDLSERLDALAMQDKRIEVVACLRDEQQFYVAVVSKLKEFVYDARDVNNATVESRDCYRFDSASDVNALIAREIVLRDVAI